jgi:hypothetical protein
MTTETAAFQDYGKSSTAKTVEMIALILMLSGAALATLTLVSDLGRFWHNYLIMFMLLISLAVGSLFYVALEYIIGANWSTPIRRVFECLAGLIPWVALLAVPIIFFGGMDKLYHHWLPAHETVVHSSHDGPQTSHESATVLKADKPSSENHVKVDPLIEGKRGYLNKPFFVFRVFLCFGLWYLFYRLLTRNSRLQDQSGDQALTGRNVRISAVFMLIFPFTLSMAAFDWMMSLEPHWFSTMFGVYYFAGTLVSAIAVITIITVNLRESGYLHPKTQRDTYYSLGLLMFAFNVFWAYITVSQFMLIWYGNLPEETVWFAHRYGGGWTFIVWFLFIFHFVIPFFALLSRNQKTNPKRLLFMAKWLVLAHILDLYFIIMPAYPNGGFFHWMDVGFLAIAVGIVMMVFSRRASQTSLVPWKDPKLNLGLGFRLYN